MSKHLLSKGEKLLIELYKKSTRDQKERPLTCGELGKDTGIQGGPLKEVLNQLGKSEFVSLNEDEIKLTEKGRNLAEELVAKNG